MQAVLRKAKLVNGKGKLLNNAIDILK
jgi:hypothetical protein